MKKSKAKIKDLRSSAIDEERKGFVLFCIYSLVERLVDINPLHEATAEEYNTVRRILFKILAQEVPDRSDLGADKKRSISGF